MDQRNIMSEEPAVDTNSKTSLFKKFVALLKADITKGMQSYTSVFNLAFMAIAVFQVIGPQFAARAVDAQAAQVANLEEQRSQAIDAVAHWKNTAEDNKVANDALTQEIAALSLKLDEAQASKGQITAAEPAKAQEAALEPPILKTKVRKVPLKKKEDPSTCDQIDACRAFVAWYEKNVSAPVTASPLVP
jgi:hypothetical protein